MIATNIAQVEYADAYSDPLPTNDTLDRMEKLLNERQYALTRLERKEAALRAVDRLNCYFVGEAERRRMTNEADHAARLVAENKREIVEVARQIVAEDAANEIVTT